jgi:caa(3)-type oxidase subunit IV
VEGERIDGAPPPGMEGEPGHLHKTPNYMAVFYTLAIFTAIEVAYSMVAAARHWPRGLLITGLVVLAGIKAVLVALYFMHLKFERKAMGILFASTLILGCILVSVGMAEHFLPRP